MILKEEIDFYERYRWSLLPFLSFDQIIENLGFLINEDISSFPEWCKKEWNINIYMLSSAAADIVDDYLVRGVHNFSKLSDYIPLMNGPVRILCGLTISNSRVRGALRDRGIRQWRESWSKWLISACEPLVADRIPDLDVQLKFREEIKPLINYQFPKNLIAKRARIPAAFRSQDLTHHDFISLSKKYNLKYPDHQSPYLIIGLRTAGSYIAPLFSASLIKEGYEKISYITIRPKDFIHPWDKYQFEKYSHPATRFILVDEPPSSGKSLARCIDILKKFGVKTSAITIAVPSHPAKRDWLDVSMRSSFGSSDIISLEPGEWYKERLLTVSEFCNTMMPYFRQLGFNDIKVTETEDIGKINNWLIQNPDRAFHVRLKKVFQVMAENDLKQRFGFPVIAKSVGWGWLGYHAALAANSLSGFVPRVYGVRNGMMYFEWANHSCEMNAKQNQNYIVEKLASYISRRTNQLRLVENPTSFLNSYRDGGFQTVALILSKAFSGKVSKLKRVWVRHQLERLNCPVPSLLDSRMMIGEWINSDKGLLKTDFEHHGFSKTASHNIVDPAYDIATAMLEFKLSDKARHDLINTYIQETGDKSIENRLIYYKLLAGNEAMSNSLNKLNMVEHFSQYHELHQEYVNSWNFLVSETMQYSALFCKGQPIRKWKEPMFVMDIDDVLDKNIFGFPSTTANGIRSISLLRTHSICTVINSARNLEEVKNYCKHYGFVGGVAEYGSVIWDDIEQHTEILISKESLEELALLREALDKIPGIFINPLYQYSIRAYSFDRIRTVPIPEVVIGELFNTLGIKQLTSKRSYIDTAIFAHSVDKGKALLYLKELKGLRSGNIAAIGDTEADLPMLKIADRGFLVANSSIELKRIARNFNISVLRSSFQSGLLEAVDTFLHGGRGRECKLCKIVSKKMGDKSDPFWNILNIADMSALQHWLHALDKNIFEIFHE